MIHVRCQKDAVDRVLERVQAVLPEARLRERRHCHLVWHVQPGALSVATMFIRMEAARSVSDMVDYSISQTTLDDVFIRFASQQRDENDDTIADGGRHFNSIDRSPVMFFLFLTGTDAMELEANGHLGSDLAVPI